MAVWSRKSDEVGPAETPAYNADRPVVASARMIKLSDQTEVQKTRLRVQRASGWQEDAWTAFDRVGEVKFAFNLVANILTRIRLYPAVITKVDAPPVRLADAIQVERPEGEVQSIAAVSIGKTVDPEMAKDAEHLFNAFMSEVNPATLWRGYGLNFQIAGECYLANVDSKWGVYSTKEIVVGVGDLITQKESEATAVGKELPKETLIGRIWRQHPKHSLDPDSNLKALADDVEELLLLSRMIRTTTRARLNAGLLFVPDGFTVSSRTPGAEDVEDEDPFMTELIENMTSPVNDEASAAALVPLVIRGPAEQGDKLKHIDLSRNSDQSLILRAERALERILQGIDVPKDVVTGLANVKYSNAVQIDENMYKAHIEPLALVLCDALTEIILRPMLRAKGWDKDEVERFVVWYDPSEVTVRPDRGQDADAGFDRFALSFDAWRKAHGFSDTDAPGEAEIATRIALEKAQIPPEVAQALLSALLPTILGKAREEEIKSSGGLPPELQQTLDGMATPPAFPEVAPVEVDSELEIPDDLSGMDAETEDSEGTLSPTPSPTPTPEKSTRSI